MANPTTYFLFLDQNSGNPLPGGLTVTVYPQGASQIPGNVVSSGTTDANGAAPLQLAASTYYTAVFTGTGAPAYPYNFQTGAFSQVVGPFVDTVNNQTIAGNKTFSGSTVLAGVNVGGAITGATTINASGNVTATANFNANPGQFQITGAAVLYGDTANIFLAPITTGSSVYIRNQGGTNNAHFPDAGGLVLDRGGLSVSGQSTTITSGAGAPSATTPSGSIYLRTDGSTGTRLYVSAGAGVWNAVAGV